MNIAIVTGASSGLGKEFVTQIDHAYTKLNEIWVIARRTDKLSALKKDVSIPIKVIDLDLTDSKSFKVIEMLLAEHTPDIKMLVNSAGYGIIGSFPDSSRDDVMGMISLNCIALTAITHICLPYMHGGSRIIQIASSAAFLPQPGFAVYAASKSYVLSFSKALSYELYERNIYVTAVCPGPVKTEFFTIAEKKESMPAYKKITMAQPTNIVRAAMKASSECKKISVYSFSMKMVHLISKVLPTDVILSLLYKRKIIKVIKNEKSN